MDVSHHEPVIKDVEVDEITWESMWNEKERRRAPDGSLICSKSPNMAPANHTSHYVCPFIVPAYIKFEVSMFYILIVVMATHRHASVKTHQIVHLNWVSFTICQSYFNFFFN